MFITLYALLTTGGFIRLVKIKEWNLFDYCQISLIFVAENYKK